MGEYHSIKTSDGEFKAYVARPSAAKATAVVVLQEIFGVNAVIRDIADDLAAKGYLAIAPDLFWRLQPGVDITDQSPEEWKQALDLMNRFDVDKGVEDIGVTLAHIRKDAGCAGKAGAVGYCLGGLLAFLTATRTDSDASVAYYGVGLGNRVGEKDKIVEPLLLHIADEDAFSSKEEQKVVTDALGAHPHATIHIYPGRNHAFARPGGENWNAEDAALANARTVDFFKAHLG